VAAMVVGEGEGDEVGCALRPATTRMSATKRRKNLGGMETD
jgi:hypothetical protein